MTELLILSAIVFAVALLLGTLREIHDDGYGHRPPPPNRYPDVFGPAGRMLR